MKHILRLSVPLTLTNISGFTLLCLSDAMIGRLGGKALAAATLANSLYGMMGTSLIWGGAAGMETLAGQAYGAGNGRVLRVLLARALCVCWALCVPVALAWQHAEAIMVGPLGQCPALAARAAGYLRALVPSLFVYVLAECLTAYCVCTHRVEPVTWAKGATAMLGPMLYYFLMFKLGLGLHGAAIAYALCSLNTALVLLGCLAWSELRSRLQEQQPPSPTNPTPSTTTAPSALATRGPPITPREVLDPRGVLEYIRFGLPSAAMTILEWWAAEVNVLLAGTLPADAEVAVAVLGIASAISGWVYMFPQSLASATCARIAAALGAGNAQDARRLAWAALTMVAFQQAVLGGTLLAVGSRVVDFFCPADPAVLTAALGLIPIMALNTLSDGANVTLNGVLRGCGRQALGARLQLCTVWAVGVPLSWVLGVKCGLGAPGFLAAVGATVAGQALICATIVARFDWDAEVQRARALLDALGGNSGSGSGGGGAES